MLFESFVLLNFFVLKMRLIFCFVLLIYSLKILICDFRQINISPVYFLWFYFFCSLRYISFLSKRPYVSRFKFHECSLLDIKDISDIHTFPLPENSLCFFFTHSLSINKWHNNSSGSSLKWNNFRVRVRLVIMGRAMCR